MIDGGLSKLFREHFPKFHWQRIESGLTGGGIPDSNYCFAGVEGWVEWKQTRTNKVIMRPDQVGWHLRRARAGGRTFIAVRLQHSGGPRRGVSVDSLYIYPGNAARSLAIEGLRSMPLGYWARSWDWERIGEILLK